MFEQAVLRERRNVYGDWLLRGGIAIAFIIFGAEKFPSNPEAPWVRLFQQIGIGQWFRYVTGIVEMVGSLLVVIPWTVSAGLLLLAATMASAVLILAFVFGHPADCIMPAGFCIGLVAFWFSRRSH